MTTLDPPTNLTFISSTMDSVTFSFTPPLGQVLFYYPYVDGVVAYGSGSPSSYTINSLNPQTSYSITLQATYFSTTSPQSTPPVIMTTKSASNLWTVLDPNITNVIYDMACSGDGKYIYTLTLSGGATGSGIFNVTAVDDKQNIIQDKSFTYRAGGSLCQSICCSLDGSIVYASSSAIPVGISSKILRNSNYGSYSTPWNSISVTSYKNIVSCTPDGEWIAYGTTEERGSIVLRKWDGSASFSTPNSYYYCIYKILCVKTSGYPILYVCFSSDKVSWSIGLFQANDFLYQNVLYLVGSSNTNIASWLTYNNKQLESDIVVYYGNSNGIWRQQLSSVVAPDFIKLPNAPSVSGNNKNATGNNALTCNYPGNIIYAINNSGIFYSNNYGDTWVNQSTIRNNNIVCAATVNNVAYAGGGNFYHYTILYPPDTPTNLTFISSSADSVTFSFTQPSGIVVTGYRPFVNGLVGTGSGTPSSYTITGLSSAQTYSITLVAYNDAGASSQSTPPVSMTTTSSPPTNVSFISSTTSSVTFSFTPPSGTITGYIPYVNGSQVTTGSGGPSSYVISGLASAGTSYSITIAAVNSGGTSAQSTAVNMFTIPNPPTNVSFISSTSDSVTFSFTPPSSQTVTGYTPYVNGLVGTGSGTSASYTITGLSPVQTYSITLVAYNNGGNSSQSNPPVSMTTTSSPPTNVSFISSTTSSVTFSFTPPSGTITGYIPYVNGSQVTTGSGGPSSYVISGLASAGTSYSITIAAVNSGGTSAQSTAVNMFTIPNPPTNLTFISSTVDSVTFSFTPPSGTVTGYTPYVNGSQAAIIGSGTPSSYTITGLATPGTSYSITLVAYNAGGNSSQSRPAVNMFTITSPPTNVTFISSTTYSVSFSFTPPSGTIIGYKSYVNGIQAPLGSGDPSSYTSYTLPPYGGYSYAITIAAVNSGGTSDQSTSVNMITVPIAPTDLTLITATEVSLTFSFQNTNNVVTGYIAYLSGEAFQTFTPPPTTNTLTITDLDPYTIYPVTLAAYNTSGTSTQSTPPVDMTTLPAVCFKEGSKILCYINNEELYVPIQNIRRGTLVKTLLHGYVPVNMIGHSKIYNPSNSVRDKDRLYKCTSSKYPELFEDLIITGCHSILVDDFISREQREKVIEINRDTFVTDRKYRLPACADDRAEPYQEEGLHNIWHFALVHEDDHMNYGVFANGLCVETTSKYMLEEYSNFELV